MSPVGSRFTSAPAVGLLCVAVVLAAAASQEPSGQPAPTGTAEAFTGVTANGAPLYGLYPVRPTGVATAAIADAARAFLDALTPEQRARVSFAVDDPRWFGWTGRYSPGQNGVRLEAMDEDARAAALGLIEASLSARGFTLARDIMRLNHTLGELNGNDFAQFDEWRYRMAMFGEPSTTEPWGWQLDGHHLAINYFVLGDQVVMSPVFMGSEPVTARSGRYAGTSVFEAEQDRGLAMLDALSPAQRRMATVDPVKEGNNDIAEASRDNVSLENFGIPASLLDEAQRAMLSGLIALYVGNLRDGHSQVRMAEVEAHLDATYFAWVGGSAPDDVYYYRIFSPVILIEFEHRLPANLADNGGEPTRNHIHTVVRTPNGNDYGKALLRQRAQLSGQED